MCIYINCIYINMYTTSHVSEEAIFDVPADVLYFQLEAVLAPNGCDS